MSNKTTTRAEARAAGAKHFFSGKPCPRGHVADRQVVNGTCLVCLSEKAAARYAARAPEILARQRELRLADHAASLAQEREYNARRRRERKDAINAYARMWAKLNRPKKAAAWARYMTTKARRTPPWLSSEHLADIQRFYDDAQRRKKEFGGQWHVDHIVPLRGKTVSGLHVPWNLQVLRAEDNERKNNQWPT